MWLYLIVNTQKGVLTCMLTIHLASHLSTQRSRGRICFSAHSMIGQPVGGAGQGDNRQVRAPWSFIWEISSLCYEWENDFDGHIRSCWINDQCRPMPDQINVVLTLMPINKYQCQPMKINTDQYFSSIDADQATSDPTMISIDPHWSALIFIESNWSLLIKIDRQWSLLSHILDQFLKCDLYWSALIGIWDWSSMSCVFRSIYVHIVQHCQ